MTLSAPSLQRAHAVFQFASFTRDAAKDERFIEAVKGEFPNVISRQQLPPEALGAAPHVVLASTSSQLALSGIQADFEVRFYGDYVDDLERAVEYLERKLATILGGLVAAEFVPVTLGVLGSVKFPFETAADPGPAEHVMSTALKTEVAPAVLQDAVARIAVRVRDTYFVSLTLSNYETRHLERPVMAGIGGIAIRAWEGDLDEVGVELGIDVNNLLEARERSELPVVTETGLGAITRLFREIAMRAGPEFVETGTLSVDAITEVSL